MGVCFHFKHIYVHYFVTTSHSCRRNISLHCVQRSNSFPSFLRLSLLPPVFPQSPVENEISSFHTKVLLLNTFFLLMPIYRPLLIYAIVLISAKNSRIKLLQIKASVTPGLRPSYNQLTIQICENRTSITETAHDWSQRS